MKIYETLKFIKTPCTTKESNKEIIYNKEKLNNELNSDLTKEQFFYKKEKNNKYNKKEIKFYKIQNVNSLQFLKIKREKIQNNYMISKGRKETESDFKEDNINFMIFSGINKDQEKKEILNNDDENNLQEIIYSDDNSLNLNDNIKDENKNENKEIFYINKNVINADKLENSNNYNKINIMENCLNKLYFDYSDGNYTNSNNYKYLNSEGQESNIIINKKIINKKFENIGKNIKNNEVINEPIINDFQLKNNLEPLKKEKDFSKENKNGLNKIASKNPNQLRPMDSIEDKENINTENIIKTSDIILSLDNETFTDKNNISNIKKGSNTKKREEFIYDNNKQDKLNEIKKINLNLNYLYENKNYLNIQLLSDRTNDTKRGKKYYRPIKIFIGIQN